MEPEQLEDIEEGKIIYDWSPPTGQKQDFFYKGSSITRDQVKKKKLCVYSKAITQCLLGE
jgi:THO complex subunit 3